ncbi:nuclear protein localization protein 4, partial [Rhizophlyctis rosea]
MLIRVRTPEKQLRVNVEGSDSIYSLIEKIASDLKASPHAVVLAWDPQGRQPLQTQTTVGGAGLKNGDQIYGDALKDETAPEPPASNTSTVSHFLVKQDPLDDELVKQKGTIKRGRHPQFCKHGDTGMCDYCMPLPPYDAKYQEENKIKHLSFHAYLKKVMDQNKTPPLTSSQFIPPLEDADFKVKVPCPAGHAPFPLGICTKCQPSAVTLQPQTFRMVDHVEIEDGKVIGGVIDFWRSTGLQRFGYLYGRYEPYSEVPLGVKAVVAAVYEPPQDNFADGVQLHLPDPKEKEVDRIAGALGLTRVGIVYTDLLDDRSGKAKVVCKRHAESFFISSAEVVFSAKQQLEHPTASKYSPTGKFGSRFVTVVLSGDENGDIHPLVYQVSNMAMSMVRDEIVEASVEAGKLRVKESTNAQYVPEVFYKFKNEYNLMIKEAAKPTFPVEYLLVTLTNGKPLEPKETFISPNSFPIENREALSGQDWRTLYEHLTAGGRGLSINLSDFHLLLYIWSLGLLEEADYKLALELVRTRDENLAVELTQRPSWKSMGVMLQEGIAQGQ